MKKEGYSRPGLFGTMNHYDNRGHKVGHSRPGLFGSVNTYVIPSSVSKQTFFVESKHLTEVCLVDSIITIIRRTGIC